MVAETQQVSKQLCTAAFIQHTGTAYLQPCTRHWAEDWHRDEQGAHQLVERRTCTRIIRTYGRLLRAHP